MNGNGMGKLQLTVVQYTRQPYSFTVPFPESTIVIWSKDGNKGNDWKYAQIDVPQSYMFRVSYTLYMCMSNEIG